METTYKSKDIVELFCEEADRRIQLSVGYKITWEIYFDYEGDTCSFYSMAARTTTSMMPQY